MKHAELIARLEAAEVGSRELDGCLYWALERPKAERAYWNAATGLPCALPDGFVPRGLGQSGVVAASPKFTTSLDAALALAERVLPEKVSSYIEVIIRGKRRTVHIGNGIDTPSWMGLTYSTSPLAVCIAILRALDSQSNTA